MSRKATCPDAFGTSRQAGTKPDMLKRCLVAVLLVLVSVQIQAQNGWTRKADLRPPSVGATASVFGGKIYVIGGMGAGSVDLASNRVYDPATNTWDTTLAPMPTPRSFPFSGVVNDTIYVLGGGYPTATTKVEAYDPITDSWDTTKADLLLARVASNAVVVDSEIIYHFGGSYYRSESQAYQPNLNYCQQMASIPPPQKGALSATLYDGLIYAFGGSNYPPWFPYSTANAYDPLSDVWLVTTLRPMPTPRFAFQTYLVNGKIYAIGGSQSQGTALAKVEVYDPVMNTWDTTRAPMPHAFAWFAGAVVNDKIYVIGGTTDWVTGGSEVWEYDPLTDVETDQQLPSRFALEQNYPNPFNPETKIGFRIQEAGFVSLKVFDMLGCEVATLVNEVKLPGTYTVQWDASGYPSGVYFYRMQAGDFTSVKKLILLN